MPQWKRIDMVGKRFGRLVGIEFAGFSGTPGVKARWLFRCDCGNEHVARGSDVRLGHILSCGCLKEIATQARLVKHGMTNTPEFKIWKSMIGRCHTATDKGFKNYGGRGITVSVDWRESFEAFFRDMGVRPAPHLMLERKNNDGPYSKSNCVWATRKEQNRNTRGTKLSVDLAKEAKTVHSSGGNMAAWAIDHNVSTDTAMRAATGRTWKD
jgi:hypothetical protein